MFEYMPMNIAPWGVEIVIYFFLVGLAAMTFVISVAPVTFGSAAEGLAKAQTPGALATLVLLVICGPLLILDLTQPARFLNPILYFRASSPLSWGSVLLILFGLSVVLFLYGQFFDRPGIKRGAAMIGSLLALTMPIYTGMDLAANQARELWATPAVPMLFVSLSLTSGAALVALILMVTGGMSESTADVIRMILAFSLGTTLLLVFSMIQTMTYGTAELQDAWAAINSEFSAQFWWLGVVLGVLVPLIVLLLPAVAPQLSAMRSPAVVTGCAVLGTIGAYTLREVIICAGQLPQLYY